MSPFRRKRSYGITGTPRFLRFFRRNTEAFVSRGNRVQLLSQGGDLIEAMLQAITEAERSVVLEFYIVRDDCTGCAFAEALFGAVARGIDVFLIYDYMGCFDTSATFFRRLIRGGVNCLPFNPPPFRRGFGWFDKRDHRKMVVVDGRTAFIGGINIGDEYAGHGESTEHWRDLGMRIDGQGAAVLQQIFRDCWVDEGGEASRLDRLEPPELPLSSDGADVMIVSGGPHHNRSLIRSAFRIAMAGASEEVRILTPYFVPGPRVLRSLLRAAGRGVRVQLILPAKSDVPLVRLISRSSYAILLRGGVEIYERQGTVLHAKVMLIDDYWAVIGSANLDNRSFHRNYEINAIVDSRAFGRQVAEMFEEDLAQSLQIVLSEHERRGLLVRLLERCCQPVSWFL